MRKKDHDRETVAKPFWWQKYQSICPVHAPDAQIHTQTKLLTAVWPVQWSIDIVTAAEMEFCQ